MIENVTVGDFRDRFQSVRPDNFSYEGLGALFDYFESMETEEEQIQLDVIAICSEYSEYESVEDFGQSYDPFEYETIEDIEAATIVIKFTRQMGASEAFIVLDF